eukprot:3722528-Prymnesium_polylepis.1
MNEGDTGCRGILRSCAGGTVLRTREFCRRQETHAVPRARTSHPAMRTWGGPAAYRCFLTVPAH